MAPIRARARHGVSNPRSRMAAATTAALEGAGFTVAGHYAPLDNARVIVVTSPELQAVAASGGGQPEGGEGVDQELLEEAPLLSLLCH